MGEERREEGLPSSYKNMEPHPHILLSFPPSLPHRWTARAPWAPTSRQRKRAFTASSLVWLAMTGSRSDLVWCAIVIMRHRYIYVHIEHISTSSPSFTFTLLPYIRFAVVHASLVLYCLPLSLSFSHSSLPPSLPPSFCRTRPT
jgi:hypothetical protein